MDRYLAVFNEKTWQQFVELNPKVCAFPDSRNRPFPKIQIGDQFLCYIAGRMVWAGVLKVCGERFRAETPLFDGGPFPIRFPVEAEALLDLDRAVPMNALEGLLSFFPIGGSSKQWGPHLRNAPKRLYAPDGLAIAERIAGTQ